MYDKEKMLKKLRAENEKFRAEISYLLKKHCQI